MARYGALVSWAKELGNKEAAATLQSTLDEERKADKMLYELATKSINHMAKAA